MPDWLKSRFDILFEAFGNSPFTFNDAAKVLNETKRNHKKEVLTHISELRKAGWLLTEQDPSDARKKIYHLKSRTEVIKKTLSFKTETLSRSDIEALLKKAADLIRTRVDYKFILISASGS